jgi:hypothetical protein
MFLNYIKAFFVKKTLKKSLHNVKSNTLTAAVQTVGLLVDASHFLEKKALIQELIANGIVRENIKVIVYNDKFNEKGAQATPAFGIKDLNWKGEIIDPIVADFIKEKFDLLISYYDEEKAVLMLITNNSKAKFKVGFSAIDKRLNHLMIAAHVANYKIFTHELFRYLKILNKL